MIKYKKKEINLAKLKAYIESKENNKNKTNELRRNI